MLEQDIDNIKFNEVVKLVESFEANVGDWAPLKIAFLRNITIYPAIPYIKLLCYQEGFKLNIYTGDYDNVMQEVLDAGSELFRYSPDIIIICLKLEVLAERLVDNFAVMNIEGINNESGCVVSYIDKILSEIRKNSNAVILLHNFETPVYPSFGILDYQDQFKQVNTVRRINFDLLDMIKKYDSAYIVDIDLLRSSIGYSNFFDHRYWHLGKMPYTRDAWKIITKEYMKFIRALKGKNKKCLILDCDNTLWGGIVGEDGIDNIKLGKTYPGSAYREFQQSVLNLYNRGVMIALCSKNNEQDVMEVLEKHPDMILRKDHFVSMKINWDDKVTNLREMSIELNIGLDSSVFIDDSDFEINQVKAMLPEVKTIKMPKDPSLYKDVLSSCGLFDSLRFSEEDRIRSGMYIAEMKRREVKNRFQGMNLEDYFKYLEMEVSIQNVDKFSLPRISQLTQRTNQFNLTTKRYSEAEIRELSSSRDNEVIYLHLKDRFGDNGIVGVAILRHEEGKSIIDSFLLSCRVIGRGVEDVLLSDCIVRACTRGSDEIVGQYLPTKKNGQVADFYIKHGFKHIENSNAMIYFLPLKEASPRFHSYFKCIKIDGVVLDNPVVQK